MNKQHYWIVNFKCWNVNHYDEFNCELTTDKMYLHKSAIRDCEKSISKEKGMKLESLIFSCASYLGEMTQEEWNQ